MASEATVILSSMAMEVLSATSTESPMLISGTVVTRNQVQDHLERWKARWFRIMQRYQLPIASPDLSASSVLPVLALQHYKAVPDRAWARKKQSPMMAPSLSTFVLDYMTSVIKKGGSVLMGFKMKTMQTVAEAVYNFSGTIVIPNQVYNHLRNWRSRWVQVLRLQRMNNVHKDGEKKTIFMDADQYFQYINDHPKDTELINKPVLNYDHMKYIFVDRVPRAPLPSTVIHQAISHLMDNPSKASKYLAMSDDGRIMCFMAFMREKDL